MDVAFAVLGALAGLCILALLKGISKHYRLSHLPGPNGWPIIGNLFQLPHARLHVKIGEWARQYGSVFKIRILNQDLVFLNDYETIREAEMSNDTAFDGRPPMFRFDYVSCYPEAKTLTLATYSPTLVKMRKEFARTLRMYGSGLTKLERMVNEETSEVMQHLKSHQGRPVDPLNDIDMLLFNVITTTLIGEKFEREDPRVDAIRVMTHRLESVVSPGILQLFDSLPFLVHFPLTISQRLKNVRRTIKDVIYDGIFKGTKDNIDRSHTRAVLDALIIGTETDDGTQLDDSHVKGLALNIFVAGVVTTSSSLYGFLMKLMHLPKLQERLHKEVDRVIGSDRMPTLEDQQEMHLMRATVLETLRTSGSPVFSVPHYTMKQATVKGYTLPKDTLVFHNHWNVHHNPDVYSDPTTFNPDRFLGEDGHLLPVDHPVRTNLLAFGIGRRACPGENLAKNRLFLIMAHFLQNFHMLPEDGVPLPSMDPHNWNFAAILNCPSYKVKFLPRV